MSHNYIDRPEIKTDLEARIADLEEHVSFLQSARNLAARQVEEEQAHQRAALAKLVDALLRAQEVMHDAYRHTGYLPASPGSRVDGRIMDAIEAYDALKARVAELEGGR